MKNSIITAALILSTAFINAQESYTLKMSVKVEGLPPEYAAYGEQDITTCVKGDKVKTEVSSMMFSSITYFDGKTYTMLSDAMGNKTGYSATKEEIDAANKDKKTDKPKIEYTSEKKTVSGYECTKAIITTLDKEKKENKTIVWITDKIKANPNMSGRTGSMDFGDLKGQPLEMEINTSRQGTEMKVKMTTTEILTTGLDDSVFKPNTDGYILSSYSKKTKKMKSMGGGK